MSFFERYFEALDGPEPYSSLDLVSDDVEFAIEWAHFVVWSATDGDTEFALGETRWDDGRFIGTFLAVAHLDADGRMDRYMVGRSPAITFPTRAHAR